MTFYLALRPGTVTERRRYGSARKATVSGLSVRRMENFSGLTRNLRNDTMCAISRKPEKVTKNVLKETQK